jgi:YbbR domain-containing protein
MTWQAIKRTIKRIWRAISRNLIWKLGSLLLAVLLWIAIEGEPELVVTHSVPIFYKNLPPDLLIGSTALDRVEVELRGPSSKLTSSNLSDLAVMVDLATVGGAGERTFTLSNNDLHPPQGVTFLRAVPSQLRLRFARLQKKDVPVQIRIAEPPPPGYRVVAQTATPDQVRITGPEVRVNQADNAQTDGIDLSAVTQTSEFRVSTFVADPLLGIESSPMVTVKVIIEKTGNMNY